MSLPERCILKESLHGSTSLSVTPRPPAPGTCWSIRCFLLSCSVPGPVLRAARTREMCHCPVVLTACGPEVLGPEAEAHWAEEGPGGEAVGRE